MSEYNILVCNNRETEDQLDYEEMTVKTEKLDHKEMLDQKDHMELVESRDKSADQVELEKKVTEEWPVTEDDKDV